MSSARAERLVNLVLCLLSTRQFLSAERIRATVPGYDGVASDEAFFRMFERDKAELRDLGIPLETGRRSMFDTVDGYRIARQDYELGDIELAADEAAAVALAARLWDSPELAGAARGALVKLRAAGVEVDEAAGAGVEPKVRATEPAFGPLLAAVQAGRAVTFEHRPHPAAESRRRTVEPWGVVSWRGRWYLVCHDRDRDDVRCFRLSRIEEPVTAIGPAGAVQAPEGTDLVGLVRDSAGPPPVIGVARVWVAEGRALGLRRLGRLLGPQEYRGRPGDELELELRSPETIARWIGGHGPDVVVLEPAELADAVRRGWAAAARAHASPTPRLADQPSGAVQPSVELGSVAR
ncbi:MAG TPA: WYL domain-containing protein [Pseudonocardia sp.]|uniref:helix-turn-helix transcriptional regulator n=1 Tax=Pseudonocardia sp. TaxID=60912 RepID=UPI002BCF4FC8|nr:WYL domain-containing protein [Pseudonocardia sp.]HTF53048.1 WYL domain-containing protein [Pseudonocardia sp.]